MGKFSNKRELTSGILTASSTVQVVAIQAADEDDEGELLLFPVLVVSALSSLAIPDHASSCVRTTFQSRQIIGVGRV